MKITKYEHACLDISEGNSRLIVDTGVFSKSITDFSNVAVVVITHVHPDHFDPRKIEEIITNNPSVQIFTTSEVSKELSSSNVQVPEIGREYQVGDIVLDFFGGQHAEIDASYPRNQNYGVLINQKLYYPGDSFTPCDKSHSHMATPAHAPWLKFSEVAELVRSSSAANIFPTHNGFLNQDGDDLLSRLFDRVCKETNKTYKFLKPGESIEV